MMLCKRRPRKKAYLILYSMSEKKVKVKIDVKQSSTVGYENPHSKTNFHSVLPGACRLYRELKISTVNIPIKCDLSMTPDLNVSVDSYLHGTDSLLWSLTRLLDLLDLRSLLPALPTRLLPAVSNFDLCYLALIL